MNFKKVYNYCYNIIINIFYITQQQQFQNIYKNKINQILNNKRYLISKMDVTYHNPNYSYDAEYIDISVRLYKQ